MSGLTPSAIGGYLNEAQFKSAGPFDALFCVGQFFPNSADQLDEFAGYLEGRAKILFPTYFICDYGVGSTKYLLAATKDEGNQGFKLDGLKVCNNLYWLIGSGNHLPQFISGVFVRSAIFW